MNTRFAIAQRVTIKAEWQEGEESEIFVVVAINGDRIQITAESDFTLPIPPRETVSDYMLQPLNH